MGLHVFCLMALGENSVLWSFPLGLLDERTRFFPFFPHQKFGPQTYSHVKDFKVMGLYVE